MKSKPVTIIVPVYGDWPSLHDCAVSLFEHVDLDKHKIMFVNDCGPDADKIEKNIKEIIAGRKNVDYYRNKKNLGFVMNCNNAVEYLDKTKNDILLLNSDTKVTAGFLEEMAEVLYLDEANAVVSPRSNNATICTVPLTAMPKRGIDKDESFKLYNKYKSKFKRFSIAPTGHGFCILIKRSAIKKLGGLFDTSFGKGYGEEVDFCQRLRAAGMQCLISNRSYVFHLEARSFSMETKKKLLEVNKKIIDERYPLYSVEVRDYVKHALEIENKIYDRFKDRLKSAVRKLTIRNTTSRR